MTHEVPDLLAGRLGYLLKHAQQQLMLAAGPALAPFGIDGRELTVLTVLAAVPLSQQEAADQLGVDRTTMVALVDALVGRHRCPEDRRKNIVELTAAGENCLRLASRARDKVEREFLAPLGDELAGHFLAALRTLAVSPPR